MEECQALQGIRNRWGVRNVRDAFEFGSDATSVKGFLEEAWNFRKRYF